MTLVTQKRNQAIRTLTLASSDLDRGLLDLMVEDGPPKLVIGFVSPHLDFAAVAASVRSGLDQQSALVLVSTAGELCSGDGAALYKSTAGAWDNIVLEAFSSSLFQDVSVHAVPLHSEDIRSGAVTLSHQQRIAAICGELEGVEPPFTLDSHDTVALVFIDGVSASESFFMEAIYATRRFPVLFIGGSAGGKLDFKATWLFDGQHVLTNHAVVMFVKLAPGMRYGVLKSQNFRKTATAFTILDGDPVQRTVTRVIDRESLEVLNFVDALSKALDCRPDQLKRKLISHTFAVELDGEMFVRSVSGIDLEAGKVAFYCDVNPGDELCLAEATDFIAQTEADVTAFLAGKPPPIGGILNDCILRRLNNSGQLDRLTVFHGIPTAGFSTFGELFGININQTLSAVFFFQEGTPGSCRDDYVSRFPVHYARFQNYFMQSRHNRLSMLNRIQRRLIRNLIARTDSAAALYATMEQVASYAERVAMDGSDAAPGTMADLVSAVRQANEEREAVVEELSLREAELRLAEDRRAAVEIRVQLEAQLQQVRKLEALGCLAGGLAHEINNMLQPIIGLTELVMEDLSPDSSAYQDLSGVIEAAQRAHRITRQVLAFSRGERGGRHPLRLAPAVRGGMEMAAVVAPRSVEIVLRIEADDLVVDADETQLIQVLVNLIRNAVDALTGRNREVEVVLDKVHLDAVMDGPWPHPSGCYAALSVRDTGCGMDAATVERIFEPFFTTKRVGEGTGLGLAMVHGIIADWNGHIQVDSTLGWGTVIRILLPALTTIETVSD